MRMGVRPGTIIAPVLENLTMIFRKPLLPALLSGTLGLLGGALAAAWYVSARVSPQPRRTFLDEYTFTPWELGVPFEAVSFSSADGLRLSGWWLPQAQPRGVLIACHGHGGSKDDMLGIGTNTWRAGYSVLLFDFRGRGESDPWPQTLVSREVDDLHAAVAFAAARAPTASLGVLGFSMGAAVAILAAATEPRIAAVVADSSFTSGRAVVAHNVRSLMPMLAASAAAPELSPQPGTAMRQAAIYQRIIQLPPEALVLAADEFVRLRHGYRFSQARPIDVVARIAPRPLLIIHGANDTLVPAAHARQLYQAAGEPRQLWIVPEVEHCGGYFIDRPAYCRRVIAFLDQYLASLP
jgi:uncharacterized protein